MLLATVLGTGIAFLDMTVVNVALPTIGKELNATVAGLQWIVNGYTLTLASLILIGGSLGDRFGRRRVFLVGVVWFALASLFCGLALGEGALVAARALQGIGGALLTPGSLAIIQASFTPGHRARAVGAWSGLSGIAAAIGPFVGGWLVGVGSWRLIFLINVPLAIAAVAVTLRYVPESRDTESVGGIDVSGAVLTAVGLAGVSWALIAAGERGATASTLTAGAIGVAALAGFLAVERRSRHPMMPLEIWRSRQFTAANLVTFVVYAAISINFFLLSVALQQVLGYPPMQAGLATVPVTALMSGDSSRVTEKPSDLVPASIGGVVSAGALWRGSQSSAFTGKGTPFFESDVASRRTSAHLATCRPPTDPFPTSAQTFGRLELQSSSGKRVACMTNHQPITQHLQPLDKHKARH